jgi:hypothetical protein
MLIELLATLSASAAAGMRIALPLLMIGLLRYDELWSNVPILSQVPPKVLIAILTSWSLFELLGSKKLLGQRVLQIIQLIFSPFAGALMAVTVAKIVNLEFIPFWIIAVIGGVLALVIKLVNVGWFFRLRGLPIWVVFLEDILCMLLVLWALEAPEQGGLIAMLLLWLAIRSSSAWRDWYLEGKKEVKNPPNPPLEL